MDNTTKKQAASLKVMAALLGDEKIDRFGKIIAEHFKHGNVDGIKKAIELLDQALNFGVSLEEDDEDTVKEAADDAKITDVIDALGVDNLNPTDHEDNIRLVLAFRLCKNDDGKFRVSKLLTASVGHPDADEEVVTMRQVLSVFVDKAVNTFLKELAKDDETSVGLFKSLKKEIASIK